MQLRDYQDYAINSVYEFFEKNPEGHPVIAMPPGTGKSVVIGAFVESALKQYPDQNIMMLTHVKELIEQNFEKLITLWPTAPAGIYSAGIGRKDANMQITYAGVASVNKKVDLFGHVDIVIIDEAHLVSPRDSTMYRKIIDQLMATNPYLKVIGLTATAYRMGQGRIIEEDGLFTGMCCDMTTKESFNWFFDEGYLCRLVPKRTTAKLDVDGVHKRGGEFIKKELQEAVDKYDVTYEALAETLEHGYDRNHCLIFASGIDHAEHIVEILEESFGVKAISVHSKMGVKERNRRIKAFEDGEYWALVNNGVLTTGYDFPAIDLLVIMRPTSSTGLWVQILGRGIRPVYEFGYDLSTKEGRLEAIAMGEKPDCLVLDFAQNTPRLGPINDPVIPRRKGDGGGGEAPVRVCEVCNSYNHASVRYCEYCGEEFPASGLAIATSAGTDELIAADKPPPKEYHIAKVDRVIYKQHNKKGKPPSIKVSYYCGLRVFTEYVCIEHPGAAGRIALKWWNNRSYEKMPLTTKEALEDITELPTATHIKVWINKKYPEIVRHDFTNTAFGTNEGVNKTA